MKRRLVIILLAVFTFWPLVHRVLVARYDVNPWKLCGLAMFCVPNPQTELHVMNASGAQLRLIPKEVITPTDLAAAKKFRMHRNLVGRLVSHRSLGRTILQEHPEFDRILIRVVTARVDRETAMFTSRTEEHFVSRDERSE